MKRLTDGEARALRVGDRVWCPEETERCSGRVIFADHDAVVVEWSLCDPNDPREEVHIRTRQFTPGDRHPRSTVANLMQ